MYTDPSIANLIISPERRGRKRLCAQSGIKSFSNCSQMGRKRTETGVPVRTAALLPIACFCLNCAIVR